MDELQVTRKTVAKYLAENRILVTTTNAISRVFPV
jgi:hypothetical protein